MSAADFLTGTDWTGARREPLAGDASSRRYERLRSGSGATAILMIAPPETHETVATFARISEHLSAAGLSAPRVLKIEASSGLLLLEDLGDAVFARVIERDPDMEDQLYRAAIDCLVAVQEVSPPAGLARMSARGLAEATDLATIWYAGAGSGVPDPDLIAAVETRLTALGPLATVPVLRDFHAENMIWLPDRAGIARVGLLDFQDMLLGHPAYDLVSLSRDARRDVAPGIGRDLLGRFAAAKGLPVAEVETAAAILGIQRNLRILGVFARLAIQGGKPGYLGLLPRVWAHLAEALADPDLADLSDAIRATLPPPDAAHLQRLAPA